MVWMRWNVASVEITITGTEQKLSSARMRRTNSSPSITGMLISVSTASMGCSANCASASAPLAASKYSTTSMPLSFTTRRMNALMAGESSTIKIRRAILYSFCEAAVCFQFLIRSGCADPKCSRPDIEPHRTRALASQIFAERQQSGFPQRFSHAQLIALADVKDSAVVHHGRSSREPDAQPRFDRTQAEAASDQRGDAGIGEHAWIFCRLRGIHARFRQQDVQQSAHRCGRIEYADADTGAEPVSHKRRGAIFRRLAIC